MLKVGIVGLPNVGKSTLFTALTKKQVDAANFPFCTIEPNVGVVEVPDARVDRLAEVGNSIKKIPTAIEFVDIAGLVKGAHQGEGLGNQFLANIRETDLILHVVRAFDGDVIHVEGRIDPAGDAEIIELELIMADLSTVEKRLAPIERKAESTKETSLVLQASGLRKYRDALMAGKLANTVELNDQEAEALKDLSLLTAKKILTVANVDEDTIAQGTFVSPFKDGRVVIPISVKIESELAVMSKEDAQEFMKELGLEMSGLDQVIKTAYDTLDLATYFTCGEQETRAWTIKKGTRAPQAAAVIHTDFEKAFIRAEVVPCEDFIELGGWAGAREKGKMAVEGKEYIVKDGDVCYFRIGD